MSYASRWSRFCSYTRTSACVSSVSSVMWPSPLWNGASGRSPSAEVIDSTMPVTRPP